MGLFTGSKRILVFVVLLLLLADPAVSGALETPRIDFARYVRESNKIVLLWWHVPEAERYAVYGKRGDAAAYEVLAHVNDGMYPLAKKMTYADQLKEGSPPGEVSYYIVAMKGEAESPPSEVAVVTVKEESDVSPPAWKRVGLRYVTEFGKSYYVADLVWHPVDGAIAYNLKRKDSETDTYRLIHSTADTRYADSALSRGRGALHSYVLTALGTSFRESAHSEERMIVVPTLRIREPDELVYITETLYAGDPENKEFVLDLITRDSCVRPNEQGVLQALEHEEGRKRVLAVLALGYDCDKSAHLSRLRKLVGDEDPLVRWAALSAISRKGGDEAGDHLLPAMKDESPVVRRKAVHLIMRDEQIRTVALVKEAMDDEDAEVRRIALEGLRPIVGWGGKASEEIIALARDAQHDADADVRREALDILSWLRTAGYSSEEFFTGPLMTALEDPEASVVLRAMMNIGDKGNPEVDERIEDWLITALSHKDSRVRKAALSYVKHRRIIRSANKVIDLLAEGGAAYGILQEWMREDRTVIDKLVAALEHEEPEARRMARLLLQGWVDRLVRHHHGPNYYTSAEWKAWWEIYKERPEHAELIITAKVRVVKPSTSEKREPFTTQGSPPPRPRGAAVVVRDVVNIRAEPARDSSIVSKVRYGEVLYFHEEIGEWYQVRNMTTFGEGYVQEDLILPLADHLAGVEERLSSGGALRTEDLCLLSDWALEKSASSKGADVREERLRELRLYEKIMARYSEEMCSSDGRERLLGMISLKGMLAVYRGEERLKEFLEHLDTITPESDVLTAYRHYIRGEALMSSGEEEEGVSEWLEVLESYPDVRTSDSKLASHPAGKALLALDGAYRARLVDGARYRSVLEKVLREAQDRDLVQTAARLRELYLWQPDSIAGETFDYSSSHRSPDGKKLIIVDHYKGKIRGVGAHPRRATLYSLRPPQAGAEVVVSDRYAWSKDNSLFAARKWVAQDSEGPFWPAPKTVISIYDSKGTELNSPGFGAAPDFLRTNDSLYYVSEFDEDGKRSAPRIIAYDIPDTEKTILHTFDDRYTFWRWTPSGRLEPSPLIERCGGLQGLLALKSEPGKELTFTLPREGKPVIQEGDDLKGECPQDH
jgi:HEAT repeat protein